MRRKPRPERDPILLEILAAIGAGGITIGPIHDKQDSAYIHGMLDGHRATINPAPDVCDTTIHEMVHRLRPEWSERSVKAKTTRLMRSMSLREIDRLYEIIMATAATRKNAVIFDDAE